MSDVRIELKRGSAHAPEALDELREDLEQEGLTVEVVHPEEESGAIADIGGWIEAFVVSVSAEVALHAIRAAANHWRDRASNREAEIVRRVEDE